MWLIDSLTSDMPGVSSAPLSLFRFLLGIAIVWKVSWEHHWGAARYFDDDSLVRWRYINRPGSIKLLLSPSAYRAFYWARIAAGAFVLTGVASQVGAIILGAWFAFEATFDRKYHTIFLCLCSFIIALSPSLDQHFSIINLGGHDPLGEFLGTSGSAAQEADPWPQILLCLLVIQMYWSSAWRKFRSRQFMSGDALRKAFEHYYLIRDHIPHREIWYPAWLMRRILAEENQVWLRAAATLTVVLEIGLPILLMLPSSWIVGVALGISMHVMFTLIMPKRLVPYGLATIATYPLFIAPHHLVQVLSVV